MSEFDDLEETDLHSSKEGASARRSRCAGKRLKTARQKTFERPLWKRQLSRAKAAETRKQRP
jgi:hypothetical protein